MWIRDLSARQKAVVTLVVMVAVGALVGVGLLLQQYGPGDMGTGFLQGAGFALVAGAVVLWRVSRDPGRATTFERAFTQTGDERDDALLTRALAVLGITTVPLTGVATVAIGLGAHVSMILFLLMVAQVTVGTVSFAVIARRS